MAARSKKTNLSRRFMGGGARPDLQKLRQEEAIERQQAWGKLNAAEKLAVLDARLGAGVGAKKQRARLATQIG
jgi:hypothetical protein